MQHSRTYRFAAGVVCILIGAGLGVAVFFILRETYPTKCDSDSNANHTDGPSGPLCPEPEVTVDSGTLRGQCRPSYLGRPPYFAFLGVPYAKPPLRDLRFKSPRPVEPWSGVRDALKLSARCTQGAVDGLSGSEDCLYLNVYSPRLVSNKTQEPLPVLLHVHGGAMDHGAGTYIQPGYWVAQDIVVVTFNYRLGRFGFLNMDTDDVPGNAGLKDVIAALKWVNRNIARFGGDPEKVTVKGCSSAAAVVHWLCLLPDTEGLFRAAIIKSASAMVSWGYTENHRALSDPSMEMLRKWNPGRGDLDILHNSTATMLELAFTHTTRRMQVPSPKEADVPTISVERRTLGDEPRLIERDPESYILRPVRSSVKKLMGIASCEYEYLGEIHYLLGDLPPTMIEQMVPRSVIPLPDALRDLGLESSYGFTYNDVLADLQATLFNLTYMDPSCNIKCRWEKYFSYRYISVDTVRSLRLHTQKAPVYAYYVEYPLSGPCGTAHARDDKITWPEDIDLVRAWNTSDPVSLLTLRMVTAFGNFVKYGNPVPKTDDVVLTTEWPPMEKEGPDVFMRFNANWTLATGDLLGEYGPMWKRIYQKYRHGKSI